MCCTILMGLMDARLLCERASEAYQSLADNACTWGQRESVFSSNYSNVGGSQHLNVPCAALLSSPNMPGKLNVRVTTRV